MSKKKTKSKIEAKEPTRIRHTVRWKREAWYDKAIPSEERRCILREINNWIEEVSTERLIELLPQIGRLAEDCQIKEAVFETTLPSDYDQERGGVVILDGETKKRPDATR